MMPTCLRACLINYKFIFDAYILLFGLYYNKLVDFKTHNKLLRNLLYLYSLFNYSKIY
jgi:hypothetical protein